MAVDLGPGSAATGRFRCSEAVAMAMRLGEVSLISPFRFIRVVFGVGVAVLILGESVEAPVIAPVILSAPPVAAPAT